MIGSMPCECPNKCGTNTTIGNLDDHLKKCSNRIFICGGVEECKFEGKKEEFLKHLIEIHEKRLFEIFDTQISNDSKEEQKTKGCLGLNAYSST